MPNEQNLRPGEYKLSQEEAKKGGINSGKVRREKKTVQKILDEVLNKPVADMPQVTKLASKLGIESEKSIKELFIAFSLFNTLKNANLGDLDKLTKLLGEQATVTDTEADKQQAFLDAIKRAVTGDN